MHIHTIQKPSRSVLNTGGKRAGRDQQENSREERTLHRIKKSRKVTFRKKEAKIRIGHKQPKTSNNSLMKTGHS